MPDSFQVQQGANQAQSNNPAAPSSGNFNVSAIPKVQGATSAPASSQSPTSTQLPAVTPPAQAVNPLSSPSSPNSNSQNQPLSPSLGTKPKEQSVEEIEEELMVGSSPGGNGQSVVAGENKEPEDFSGGSIQQSHLKPNQPTKPLEPKEAVYKPPQVQETLPKEEISAKPEPPAPVKDEAAVKDQADAASLPYVNLVGFSIQPETLNLIPKEIAAKYKVVAYIKIHHQARVAALDPQDKEMISKITETLEKEGYEPLFSYCSEASIKYALGNYKEEETSKVEDKINAEQGEVEFGAKPLEDKKNDDVQRQVQGFLNLKQEIKKVSTSKLFDVLVSGALRVNSSDIHIEPKKDNMKIRYRVDGILQDIAELPFESYKSLISRIKFLAKMKLDLKNLPQDGRFTIKSGEDVIDLRVSVLPTVYGESVVMRLLKQDKGFLTIEELGFNQRAQELIEEAINKPTGMILNTGPTGSGKTTTLYAILAKLNKPGVKIITLEDPVEYRIDGVTQSQVDSYAKYGFARGLRSILRQDPDIVMVGEIRDLETARIALNASLTGHLVLSTLHTNNATAAASRLLELGVKPFLIAGNINLIIAQRLVRKLCDKCKKKYHPRPGILEAIKRVLPKNKTPEFLWREIGCSECHGTGFAGRVPVVEAFRPSTTIEKMIIDSAPAAKIRNAAIDEGMITMEQDGISKALDGVTTVQEVWRVTKE